MSMERGRFGNVVSFAGHRVGEARGSNAKAARIAAAGVSTAALRLCALRDLGGLDLRLSAALALCSPLGESASVTRGAAESLSNVVRTGGGRLAGGHGGRACGVGWVLGGAWPFCDRHHALRAVVRHEMRPVWAGEVDLWRSNAHTVCLNLL